jgi:tRNA(His) guanylyltransferase
MSNDTLGDRIKAYEQASRPYLTKRTPVICRVDGRAFHTFTRGLEKPYDQTLIQAMVNAATAVAMDMQGFKIGYIQSDEASFLITDYDDINTQGWFNYNLSKMISVSASVMTANFNADISWNNIATFDSRAFNISPMDMSNYFLWRAKDWSRNSLQMFCRSIFSHKQLEGKKREDMHEMLYSVGKNWTTDTTPQQRNGTFIIKSDIGMTMLYDVMPNYQSINKIIEEALGKEEV